MTPPPGGGSGDRNTSRRRRSIRVVGLRLEGYFWINGFGFVLGDVKALATGRDSSCL